MFFIIWKKIKICYIESSLYRKYKEGRLFYKEHLYKKLEAEKGSKNKEFLRNWPGWNKSSNLRNTKEH